MEEIEKPKGTNDNRQQSSSQNKNTDYDLRLEVVQKIGEKDDFLSFDLNHTYR